MQFKTLANLCILFVGTVVHLNLMDQYVQKDPTAASTFNAVALLLLMSSWRPIPDSGVRDGFVNELADLALRLILVEFLALCIWLPNKEYLGVYLEYVKQEYPSWEEWNESLVLLLYVVAACQANIIIVGLFWLINTEEDEEEEDMNEVYMYRQNAGEPFENWQWAVNDPTE